MYCVKVAKFRSHLQLQYEFEYRPLVFSCYGRVHPEACSILKTLAKGAARWHGVIDFKGLLARVYRNISVEIWRCAASMGYDCIPKLYDYESDFLHGRDLTVVLVSDADIAAVVCSDLSTVGGT